MTSSWRSEAPPADPSSLRAWLGARSDAQLGELLRRRPDLALPPPADLATLAARAVVRSSLQRAVDRLDAFALRVLAAIVTAAGDHGASPTELTSGFGDVDSVVLRDRITDLMTLALVRDDPATGELLPVGQLGEVLGPTRTGLGRGAEIAFALLSDGQLSPVLRGLGLPRTSQPAAGRTVAALLAEPGRLAELLAEAPADALDIVRRLAVTPLGTTPAGALRLHRDLAGHTAYAADPPLAWLLNHGLLVPVDERTVELPREVALAARSGAAIAPIEPEPPEVPLAERPVDVDAVGTTAVLQVLRWVDALAQEWSANPPAVLRAGGLGVRELRRTAKVLDISEADVALLVEVAAYAGLVGPDNTVPPSFLPTSAFDSWTRREPAQRWTTLARAWLTMTRQPDLVGCRDDRARVVTALGFDVERGTAPSLRGETLAVLAQLPPGSVPRDEAGVLARLAWAAPRRAGANKAAAAATLREADVLGITAAGALTSYGRAALAAAADAATARSWGEPESALDAALPEPVDTVLVQPDLTVVVPGQPVPDLARELALVADLESSGGAAVYRVGETSLRRAFDAGRSGTDLLEFFTARSSTPVPQALQYLIDDLGRRYGALRAGAATSYLRCDDEALLSRVLGGHHANGLGLRRLAPTVAVSGLTPARLLDGLRAAGFAPAAESPTGTVLALGDEPARAPARRGTRPVRTQGLSDEQVRQAVTRLRSGEELSRLRATSAATVLDVPGVTSASMLATIRDAIKTERALYLGYVDDTGTASARTILPISMAGGHVRGQDPDGGALESFLLHRIVMARTLDRGDDD